MFCNFWQLFFDSKFLHHWHRCTMKANVFKKDFIFFLCPCKELLLLNNEIPFTCFFFNHLIFIYIFIGIVSNVDGLIHQNRVLISVAHEICVFYICNSENARKEQSMTRLLIWLWNLQYLSAVVAWETSGCKVENSNKK